MAMAEFHKDMLRTGPYWDMSILRTDIIHVVDAYFAMTQPRPYRPALSLRAATSELRRHAGRQFDPELVRVLVDA